jgi:hypothetical protein
MDLLFIELIALLIVLLLLLIARVSRLRKARQTEPVTQTEHELQYKLLMQEIQLLEEAVEKGNASRKLRNKLDAKRDQAQKLNTLISKSMIVDVPDPYQTERNLRNSSLHKTRPVNPNTIYLCPKCRKQVRADDKFCANCGFKLQTKRQI